MSRAEGLRVWLDFLSGMDKPVLLEPAALDLLRLTLETAIAEIEALETPSRLERLAAKAAREPDVAGHADAIVAGVRSGKVSLLPRYRAGMGPSGGDAA